MIFHLFSRRKPQSALRSTFSTRSHRRYLNAIAGYKKSIANADKAIREIDKTLKEVK